MISSLRIVDNVPFPANGEKTLAVPLRAKIVFP